MYLVTKSGTESQLHPVKLPESFAIKNHMLNILSAIDKLWSIPQE